jgi:hypothetical protein
MAWLYPRWPSALVKLFNTAVFENSRSGKRKRVLGCLRCFVQRDLCFIDLWPPRHWPIMLLSQRYFLLGGNPLRIGHSLSGGAKIGVAVLRFIWLAYAEVHFALSDSSFTCVCP